MPGATNRSGPTGRRASIARHLRPRFEWGRWCGDGLHSRSDAVTSLDGRYFAISWLGLHLECALAAERGQRR